MVVVSRVFWVLVGLFFQCYSAQANENKNLALFFGDNFAYFLSAPNNWTLNARRQSALYSPMSFYPAKYKKYIRKNNKHRNSPVVVYGLSAERMSGKNPIDKQVAKTLALFKKRGRAGYRKTQQKIYTVGNRNIPIYFFADGKNGYREVSAYFLEKYTINFIVYSAKNEKLLKKYYPDFVKILASYNNIYDRQERLSRREFKSQVLAARRLYASKAGKIYRQKMLTKFSTRMASFLNSCLRINQTSNISKIDLVFHVNKDGSIKSAYVWPLNSLSNCIRALVQTTRHPSHNFVTNFQYFELSIQ